ncbi:MAG: flagellar hook capping FlgD N-terminal domain-containing protein [Bacillota bacterium]
MEVGYAAGVNNYPGQAAVPASPGTLSKDAFLQLLVAQLKYQDPINPQGSEDFVNQLVQLSTVEQLYNLSQGMNRLLELSQLSEAVSLVGRVATVKGNDESLLSGVVEKVGLAEGKIYLYIEGKAFELSQLTEVR